MEILLAETLGMCFGVRDALKLIEDIDQPEDVTIHGELVHNETVLRNLQSLGFRQVDEERRTELPDTSHVLITAHGVSENERRRLEQAGKILLDSTCPLVERAHAAARKLEADGCFVLVIGRRGHVEVEGIIGDLTRFEVIQSVDEVRAWPHPRLGIMCQTTTPVPHADGIRREIERCNPAADIRFLDTICHPTKDHQAALERLLERVQALVVVGGRNSNNTRQLAEKARARGIPAHHIQSAGDLRPQWFEGLERVGLTAGTSTLDETIREVHEALLRMAEAYASV